MLLFYFSPFRSFQIFRFVLPDRGMLLYIEKNASVLSPLGLNFLIRKVSPVLSAFPTFVFHEKNRNRENVYYYRIEDQSSLSSSRSLARID